METIVDSKENEVKSWLKTALSQENLEEFSVKIIGNSEEGDGYVGEVIFVEVTGTDQEGSNKDYSLVLKCNKTSEALIKKSPTLQEAFIREIYMYEKIFPLFKQFQVNRSVEDPFESVPKCYGVFNDKNRYVIVLENLKKSGYDLWNNSGPKTRQHIDLVIKEYAKFHAISVALREQDPEKYEQAITPLKVNIFKEFFKTSDFISVFESNVEQIYNLLQDHLEEHILEKWLNFKDQIRFICLEMTPTNEDLQVIIHGDCWNNNFMYKYKDSEKSNLSKVAILDWQISCISSPVIDLSYFLFSCISVQDLSSLDIILRNYYDSLSDNLGKLGSVFVNHYTFDKFLEEWKKFGRFGIVLCQLPIKIAYIDRDEKPDMVKSAENGEDISRAFEFGVKNKTGYINRVKPIVQLAVEAGLI